MKLGKINSVLTKVALTAAVASGMAFQAGGCSVNLTGEEVTGIIDSLLQEVPDEGSWGSYDDFGGYDDWSAPAYPEYPAYPDYPDMGGWF